jgi:glycosyltransferase involved in cell wall biosynthesis
MMLDNSGLPAKIQGTIHTSMTPTPKVSIVTPSFNQARFLPDTLRSVREQDYPNIEHIVVDGASTDGSVDILRKAPGIRWLSEKDRGQVDALNKGFAMATGEVLGWLCSDDTLSPDTVNTAVAALQRTGAELVYGEGEIIDEHGELVTMARVIPFDYRMLLCCNNWLPQPTVFFRRELLQKAGPLREEFDNAFDYELWLRMARFGKFSYAPEIRAQLRRHADAKTVARENVTLRNYDSIRPEYWGYGGLAPFLCRKPWFFAVHYYYRFKRRLAWFRLKQGRRA